MVAFSEVPRILFLFVKEALFFLIAKTFP